VKLKTALALFLAVACLAGSAAAEEDDAQLHVNGHLKLQTGVFVPLLSDMFKAQKGEAYLKTAGGTWRYDRPCDPVVQPSVPCTPKNHGIPAGELSMFRATLQLEGDWQPHESVSVHAIFRGVRSLMVNADGIAGMPRPPMELEEWNGLGGIERRRVARQWVLDNYYTEFDLREIYVDALITEWLSFRIGRQQVTWGETGQYRLLDAINPIDSTWHFGPLESFEDTRIPLWIVKGLLEFPSIDHSLEVVWVPGIDRPEDMVTVPLSFVGAWGPPRTNTPPPFIVDEQIFLYPENSIEDTMRIGFRWKGALSTNMTFSLVYYYTHQIDMPVPSHYDMLRLEDGTLDDGHLERVYLKFPRQHLTGFSVDLALDNPIGAIVRLEATLEPDRTIPQISDTRYKHQDPAKEERWHYDNPKKMAVNYAVQIIRPTMIRFLNPTQNFLLVLQWMHTMVPDISEEEESILVEVPGFDDWNLQKHSMSLVAVINTQYLNGLLTPTIIGAWVVPDSGFISASLDLRLGVHWRARLAVTDFFGKDAYKGAGLFRDRDEINLTILCQF
jgi:hypothetical protein